MMFLIYTQVCKSSMFIEGQLGRGNCIIFIGIDKDLNVYVNVYDIAYINIWLVMLMLINSHLNELEGNV